jgi:soluble lytic murein transglycosylase-like protein
MAYYPTTMQLVDSPLDEFLEEDEFFLGDGYAQIDPTQDVQQRMLMILGVTILILFGLGTLVLRQFRDNGNIATGQGEAVSEAGVVTDAAAAQNVPGTGGGVISPLFTREVQYWAPQILSWAAAAGVDPNMAATIMQIESCGDPQAVSSAGASGLFQVMPFHFTDGEDRFNPDTNAFRGLNYFAERMQQTGGDVGRAFAGYNGGHVAAGGTWDSWAPETQRYYTWSTGIFADVQAGNSSSETLNRWLQAGGAGLCQQAAQRLGLQ